ncbi:hypothetical protein EHS25_009777 [Saitozyma podzolica]|uniref:Uncharacterized protein n=1 Tax=Saitozyma podzolica TaxID=1890683 RepID=A0A427YK55_9TREE|nr:hypothetical protein EHS25_009777 [Saitozyma podzolica]
MGRRPSHPEDDARITPIARTTSLTAGRENKRLDGQWNQLSPGDLVVASNGPASLHGRWSLREVKQIPQHGTGTRPFGVRDGVLRYTTGSSVSKRGGTTAGMPTRPPSSAIEGFQQEGRQMGTHHGKAGVEARAGGHGRANSDSSLSGVSTIRQRRPADRDSTVKIRARAISSTSAGTATDYEDDLVARHALGSGHTHQHHRVASWDGRSALSQGILLGGPEDLPHVTKILVTLYAITPASRSSSSMARHDNGRDDRMFHLSTLLAPLSLILEALVTERCVLRSLSTPSLPPLRDGTTFQLSTQYEDGDSGGELDWQVICSYVLAVGRILDELLPYLRDSYDRDQVKETTETVRMYVGKMKKVFGEVAGCMWMGMGF